MGPRKIKAPRLTVAAMAAGLTLFLTGALASGPSSPQSDWPDEQWLEWRDKEIARILAPAEFQSESVIVRDLVAKRCAESLAFMGDQSERLGDTPGMRNFVAFVVGQARQTRPGHALGLDISDGAYWLEARGFVALPPLLQSQAFLSTLQSPRTYKDAVEMIELREPSWIVLPFKARFIKSVDRTTYGRLLIFAPDQEGPNGELCDKWVTFAIATPDQSPQLRPVSVSVVTVAKSQDGNRAFFMDYLRNADGGTIELMPTAVLHQSPSKSCYDCHKSAVVPISPETVYEFASGGLEDSDSEAHVALNAKIRAYGDVTMPAYDKAAFGPSAGPSDSPYRAQIVADMPLSESSKARVAKAMDCARCHNGFARLNYPEPLRTDREVRSMRLGKGLAQTFVEEGVMPPGNDLTAEERRTLWMGLVREYYDPTAGTGILVDWLRGRN